MLAGMFNSLRQLRLIVLPTLAAATISACARTAAQAADPALPQVTTAEVISREITEWDEFTGRLEAVNTVAVRPRVSGYVAAVRFQEGAIVSRGDRSPWSSRSSSPLARTTSATPQAPSMAAEA